MEMDQRTIVRPYADKPSLLEARIAPQRYSVFTHQLENSNPNKPCEDAVPLYYEIGSGVYAAGIFDGITRSPLADGTYPSYLSPALLAADEMQRATSALLAKELAAASQDREEPNYAVALRNTLSRLNTHIRSFNASQGFTEKTVDYGEMDMPGAAALLGIIANNTLYTAMIADCAAYVFGATGARLTTPIQTNWKDQYKAYLAAGDNQFDNELWRKFYRKHFRNNPHAIGIMNGVVRPMGYGAITGENGADAFIVVAEEYLEPDDIVFLSSDGCLSVSPDDMNEIILRRLEEGKPDIILPEIFGKAQYLANKKGKHSDDRTGVLFIPEQYTQIPRGGGIVSPYTIDA